MVTDLLTEPIRREIFCWQRTSLLPIPRSSMTPLPTYLNYFNIRKHHAEYGLLYSSFHTQLSAHHVDFRNTEFMIVLLYASVSSSTTLTASLRYYSCARPFFRLGLTITIIPLLWDLLLPRIELIRLGIRIVLSVIRAIVLAEIGTKYTIYSIWQLSPLT